MSSLAMDRAMLEWSRRRPGDGYTFGVLMGVGGPMPPLPRLAALVQRRAADVPCLSWHLTGPPREETWQPYQGFDAGAHIHRLELPPGPDPHTRALTVLANQQVPGAGPLWGLWALDGDQPDTYLLGYLVHQAAQDGVGAAHALERLFGDTCGDGAEDGIAESDGQPEPLVGSGVPSLATTGQRSLVTAAVPLDLLRAAAGSGPSTVHDAYLAALAGALRWWLPPADSSHDVPVRVPFSIRQPDDDPALGNHVGNARLLLPVTEPDPARRLAEVTRQMSAVKTPAHRERTRGRLARVPEQQLLRRIPEPVSPVDSLLCATSLRIRQPLTVAGAPVVTAAAVPPLVGGHLLTSMLCTHDTGAAVSFTTQIAHQEIRRLPALWQEAVVELAAAV
ncbi:wax ester/triacylglycerol synthase domain-containing protein [Streptantibioticus rubrisoli]|uniref:O-acyltransferase WSD1-like N-terminal domain-containing protein n=1 Tax=Streptantibioticus rubrisoli TaxID=1387313 RepID=A0ABT1P6R1_9ACTN|nr:wax ester/triacylglycerol synthase domain-containing protein [Streptantibioticus rubrisoli]MCQ4041027.1 hypothetical protein [Streptantibioticus rubrisoli]